ncbi:hypothetical protein [Viridibacillus arvi]|nr:hypothetical protein [Viridibacillus arvi]
MVAESNHLVQERAVQVKKMNQSTPFVGEDNSLHIGGVASGY